MPPPPICLHCGHLDGAEPCARCGRPAPEVRWGTRDGYTSAVKRALDAVGLGLLGLALAGLATAMVIGSLRRPSVGVHEVFFCALALLVLGFAGLALWAAGHTGLLRSWSFEANDERVSGHVTTLAGRLHEGFGLSYTEVAAKVPSEAAALGSSVPPEVAAAALAALPARLREVAHVDDGQLVVVAAILGMAARGEIAIEPGEPQRFWIGARPKTAPSWIRRRVWLRRTGSAVPALAFEKALIRHLEALALARAAPPAPGPDGYRTAAGAEAAPSVPLLDVMVELAGERVDDAEAAACVGALCVPAPHQPGVGVALAAAVAADPETAVAIALEASDGIEVAAG